MAKKIGRKAVVTTEFRGVFFGEIEKGEVGGVVTLKNARNCIMWVKEVGGVLGLGVVGPIGGSRVGRVAPRLELAKVTAIFDCTPEAIAVWEKAPCVS